MSAPLRNALISSALSEPVACVICVWATVTHCHRAPVATIPPQAASYCCLCVAARIADMVRDQSLDLGAVHFFVLDEADRLVDQDGLDMVMQLYSALPKGGAGTARLQVCMIDCCVLSSVSSSLLNPSSDCQSRQLESQLQACSRPAVWGHVRRSTCPDLF